MARQAGAIAQRLAKRHSPPRAFRSWTRGFGMAHARRLMAKASQISRLAWLVGLCLAIAAGTGACKGRGAPGDAKPAVQPAPAAAKPVVRQRAEAVPAPAAAAAAAATATEAAPEPQVAAPMAVRRAIAQIPMAAPAAGVRLGERWAAVWRADRHWQARAIDGAGRTVWDAPQVAAPEGAVDSVLAAGAGANVWVAAARGLQVACLQGSGPGGVKALRTPVVGLIGQADGSAVVVLTNGGATAQLARLNADFSAVWETELALPGAVTAVTATLRDDLLLIGRGQGATTGWWAARVSHSDGNLAWTLKIPVKCLPADADLLAVAPSSRGAVLYAADRKAARSWTALALDANGRVEWSQPLDRRAPRVVAAAAEQGSWMAQTRDGQVLLQGLDTHGKPGASVAAYALDLEEPLALGSDGRAAWLLSRAPHPTGSGSELLFTRWGLGDGTAAPTCEPGPCQAVRRDRDRCARVTLADGSACGSGASCAAGQCVRKRL